MYRLGAIIGDAATGCVRQFNGIHGVIRCFYHGWLPLLVGRAETLVDLIPDGFAATAIQHLYDHPEIVERMSVAARERVVENFTWDHFRTRLLGAYERAMQMVR